MAGAVVASKAITTRKRQDRDLRKAARQSPGTQGKVGSHTAMGYASCQWQGDWGFDTDRPGDRKEGGQLSSL